MTKKNNKYKVLFIKNNGLDMKEISFSKIISLLSVLAVFIFTVVIVAIFSSDLVLLIQKSQDAFTSNLEDEKKKIEKNVISNVKNDNTVLEKEIISQGFLIDSLLIELELIKVRDESLRKFLKLPSIDDDTRKLSIGGSNRDQSFNELNYLLPNDIDIYYLNEQIKFINRTIKLENLSYSEMEDKLDKKNLDYFLGYPAIYPVSLEETYISSTFGPRTDPYTQKKQHHKGDDFAGRSGVTVVATADGIVKNSKRYGTFGNFVEIDHGNGYVTKYAHLRNRSVKKGEKVSRGQKIGTIGNTGRSTAPHLHYEVLYKGKNQDPHNFYFIPNLDS